MTRQTSKPLLALCSAVSIAAGSDGSSDAPEWVMVLPAGQIGTNDGRGPYTVKSMTAFAAEMNAAGGSRVIDECHSTDRAQPLGAPAPARGWMTEFEERDGALWAKVDWTPTGTQLMAEKAYRGLSPVIQHLKDGTIVTVLRASLTNTPNLTGLTALHSEEDQGMDWKAKLIELLGLDGEADDAAIDAALTAKMAKQPEVAAHSEGADTAAITALQSELAGVTDQLTALQSATATKDATAFVDAAIARGRVGVKPLRERYIAMHAADPAGTAELINAMPVLSGTTITADVPDVSADDQPTDPVLLAADAQVYQAKLAASGQTIDFATAVMAVKEGRNS